MCAVAMGTSEWEAFVPRSHMPHLLTWGRRVFFFAFIDTAPPLLLTSSFLSSCRPAYSSNRRGDFFLPTHHHVIIACLPFPADVALIYPCGCLAFFGGFIWILNRLLARPAVPHPFPMPAMSSFQSSRSSSRPTGSHRLSPRSSTRRAGRVACFQCGAFHVRTMRYNSRPHFPSNHSSPRLLAPSPPYPSIPGRLSPSVGRL